MSKKKESSVLKGKELLKKVRALLKSEGVTSSEKLQVENEIESYLLPVLDKFREVQHLIYEPFLYEESGVIKKLKNKILEKVGNVTRNVVEKSFMRQQKYNDSVHTLLIHLYTKNRELEDRLQKLERINRKKE